MSNGGVDNKVFEMMAAVADKTDVSLEEVDKPESQDKNQDKSTESIHNALMAAGMTPAYGNIADLADATLYALEGELGNAAWSAASALPIIGQMVAGKRALKIAKEAGEEIVTVYRAVGKEGIQAKGGKFIGGPKMKCELYATLDHRVAKKYKSLNPDRVIMEFEVPKKWLLKNEGTIQKAIRKGDTWWVDFRRKMIESGKSTEVRFSEEVGLPEGFLKKVHK